MPIRAYDALSDACIEQWVVHHRWGDACRGTDMKHSLRFDAVWAWVNGSDPAQILARNTYKPSSPINVDAAHRYADHNELLYSMRSLYHSFGGHSIGKMHIMASAYPLPKKLSRLWESLQTRPSTRDRSPTGSTRLPTANKTRFRYTTTPLISDLCSSTVPTSSRQPK